MIRPTNQQRNRRSPSMSQRSHRPLMMMMMMTMDELTLTWHIVLRLQGHVTVKKESRIVDALVDCTSRDSCMSERKARGLQSTTKNWQWWRSPNGLWQTVPNRCGSCREGTVADGSTVGSRLQSPARSLLKFVGKTSLRFGNMKHTCKLQWAQ